MNEVRSTNGFPPGSLPVEARGQTKSQTIDRATSTKTRRDITSVFDGITENRDCQMAWPAAGAARSRASGRGRCCEPRPWWTVTRQGFGGQASKSIRWMPWHQEAMKDVVKLRKATVSRIQASTRRSPNRETDIESCRCGLRLNT